MSPSGDDSSKDHSSRAADYPSTNLPDILPLPAPILLPYRINQAAHSISSQGVNDKPTRLQPPPPSTEISTSPKKDVHDPSINPIVADTTPFGIQQPTTASSKDGDGSIAMGNDNDQVKLQHNSRPSWSNIPSSPTRAPETSALDVYAPSYIPLWLRAVNDSAAVTSFCSLLETIDYQEYINSFAGGQYLQPLTNVNLPPILPVQVVHSISPDLLTPTNYASYFGEAFQNEIFAQAAELHTFNTFAANFEIHDPLQQVYRVKVAGLRENSPRISLGDIVLVRPLFHHPDAPALAPAWCAPGGGKDMGHCAPGFTGQEFRAVVWGFLLLRDEILLRVDGLTNTICNMTYVIQQHAMMPIARIISSTAEFLAGSHSPLVTSDWLSRMLFPRTTDGVEQLNLSQGRFPNMKWIDTQLNYEQQKAVHAVFQSNYGSVPYLISGPPGTGKTKSIVEIALQLLQRADYVTGNDHSNKLAPHILICAPSDSAADTLASRLAARLAPIELFRLNGWSRSFAEVPGRLLPYSYVHNDLFSLPSFETLMSYKVVVTTCRDADMLVQGQLTNRALTHLTRSVLRAVAPNVSRAVPRSQLLHWTALLIDEAAQATEPEAVIPLSVVVPPIEAQTLSSDLSCLPQFIMAGDQHQLGPRISSGRASALSTSLFERLFCRPLYAQHPLSLQMGSQRLTASMLPMIRPAFTNLIRNYRSHPSILSVPSQLFYNDTLIPERTTISEVTRTWPGWKSRQSWPVLFVQNTTADATESFVGGDGTGASVLFNPGEVMAAAKLVHSLVDHRVPNYEVSEQINQHEIVVMSPFKTQVKLLRKVFREKGLPRVNIGPLEAFQGLEARIVVLCTTRTRRGGKENPADRFVRQDQFRGVGVIGEPKRFNVAVTRAKEGLIVLGDPETLTVLGDPCWTAFISFCVRNGCVMPETDERASDLDWTETLSQKESIKEGRLERALVFAADVKMREEIRNQQKGFGYAESSLTRQQKKVSLKGQLLANDEEMWKMGLQMAEEMDEATSVENVDGDADQGAGHATGGEDADPWNSEEVANGKIGGVMAPVSRMESSISERPYLAVNARNKDEENEQKAGEESWRKSKRVLSGASAEEFDRDPKTEFEKSDCATQ